MKQINHILGVHLSPFLIAFAKQVNFPFDAERKVHKLLSKRLRRVNTRREYFVCSINEIRKIFDKIDGEYFDEELANSINNIYIGKFKIECRKFKERIEQIEDIEDIEDIEEIEECKEFEEFKILTEIEEQKIEAPRCDPEFLLNMCIEDIRKSDEQTGKNSQVVIDQLLNLNKPNKIKKHNDIYNRLKDGQEVRHVINENDIWVGICNKKSKVILCNGTIYRNLLHMCSEHYKSLNGKMIKKNIWNECEYKIGKNWISTNNL
jgi:hypothetical protein